MTMMKAKEISEKLYLDIDRWMNGHSDDNVESLP